MATEQERADQWLVDRGAAALESRSVGAVPAVAAGSSDDTALGELSNGGTVTAVTFIPNADITGAATNTRKLTLYNRGADGDGTTAIATLQFDSGTDAAAFDGTAITLSSTSANLAVSAGDVLSWASDKVGTGIADPGGTVLVTVAY